MEDSLTRIRTAAQVLLALCVGTALFAPLYGDTAFYDAQGHRVGAESASTVWAREPTARWAIVAVFLLLSFALWGVGTRTDRAGRVIFGAAVVIALCFALATAFSVGILLVPGIVAVVGVAFVHSRANRAGSTVR
jgi:hypothetical protein